MKNAEKLIGKKVKGFKFETIKNRIVYANKMNEFIKVIGIVEHYNRYNNSYTVRFNDLVSFFYPADQIEAHLVEDEIPTLSDGVMMLVSNSGANYIPKKVLFKKNNMYYAFCSLKEVLVVGYKYAKPLEPTKEEQLKAILGSDEKVSEIMELFKD